MYQNYANYTLIIHLPKFNPRCKFVFATFFKHSFFNIHVQHIHVSNSCFYCIKNIIQIHFWNLSSTYKASFSLKKIILFPLITSLRYMRRGNGWIADSFNVTPPVSSYLLAFIICDFDYKENMTSNGIRVRVVCH